MLEVDTQTFVSITQQSDGAWLCKVRVEPHGIEEYTARRTKTRALAWAREVLEVKRLKWDTDLGHYMAVTKDGKGEM